MTPKKLLVSEFVDSTPLPSSMLPLPPMAATVSENPLKRKVVPAERFKSVLSDKTLFAATSSAPPSTCVAPALVFGPDNARVPIPYFSIVPVPVKAPENVELFDDVVRKVPASKTTEPAPDSDPTCGENPFRSRVPASTRLEPVGIALALPRFNVALLPTMVLPVYVLAALSVTVPRSIAALTGPVSGTETDPPRRS